MSRAGGDGDGGGKVWFDKGRVMVVEKGRLSKEDGLLVVEVVVWWRGEITTTRAREPERAERPLSSDVLLFLCFVFVFGLICLFVSVYVYVSVLCFCIYLFVHCTQYFLEFFQKTDPATGSSVESRESHVRQPSAE
jgi:hypothetical protein